MKPIHKFNGGLGATLCNSCSVVISTGLTEDLYCEKCKQKNLLIEIMEADEKDGLYKTNNMKLYTEEQLLDSLKLVAYSNFTTFQSIIDKLHPIELPSDEEMDKFLLDNSYEYGYGYKDAIQWMKEQILKQNK